jgi:hypothetical protein
MGTEFIRRARVAMQHATEARTVEFQARHADEARGAFERAVRLARLRFDRAEQRQSEAARVIARHAVILELESLQRLEDELTAIEARVADAIVAMTDPRDFRRLRLAD